MPIAWRESPKFGAQISRRMRDIKFEFWQLGALLNTHRLRQTARNGHTIMARWRQVVAENSFGIPPFHDQFGCFYERQGGPMHKRTSQFSFIDTNWIWDEVPLELSHLFGAIFRLRPISETVSVKVVSIFNALEKSNSSQKWRTIKFSQQT